MKHGTTLLIACAVLTACSSSPPVTEQKSAYQDVASIVAAVTKAVDAQPTYRFTISPPSSGGITAPSTGVVKLTGQKTANIDTTTERPVQSGGKNERLRFVSTNSDSAFVELPAVFGLPADKPWIKLARSDTDDFTATMLGFHDVIYQQAVFTSYHLPLIAAGGKLNLTAQTGDRIRYSIDVDYRKAYDTLTDENLRNEIKLALDQNVTTSVGEIELDSRDLPTRVKFTTQFKEGLIVHDARFSDWGTSASIAEAAPSAVSPRR